MGNLQRAYYDDRTYNTPISKVIDGDIAISNTVNSKTFGAFIYTGIATSQHITTGINSCDFTVAVNGSGFFSVRKERREPGYIP